ncbi:hypothetical protein I553_1683 [Mycobacterium xenopi 4042]|uniref:Uncharacterized protein n=1 Tax=Mycobacterium xenopi 4042 TaxID=1299334 RepID=X8CHD1_MYCXE|nr:hypothetical protein I553_1683 [Mycobacterium xenopi 4042]
MIGPIWRRDAVFDFNGAVIDSQEFFFVYRTRRFEPTITGRTELERRYIHAARWCTAADIAELAAAGETVYPLQLSELLADANALADRRALQPRPSCSPSADVSRGRLRGRSRVRTAMRAHSRSDQSVVQALHRAVAQVVGHGEQVDVRKQSGRSGNIRVAGPVIAQLDNHAQVGLEEVGQRVPYDGDLTQRFQERQILRRDQVVGGGTGVPRRHRLLHSRSKLCGREIRIRAVQVIDACNGVGIGDEINWVLREIGPAVVLDRVNRGGVGRVWRVAPLKSTSRPGMYKPWKRSRIPPLGLFGSPSSTKESWSGLGRALAGNALRWRISRVATVALCE